MKSSPSSGTSLLVPKSVTICVHPDLLLTFLHQVGANIIAMYPSTTLFIAIGQLAIAILVMFSYPLQVHPCRNCLDKIFHVGDNTITAAEEEDDDVVDDHGSGEMSAFKHATLTAAIILSGFTIAYFVDDLQMGEFLYVSLLLLVTISLQCFPSLGRRGQLQYRSFSPGYSFGRSAFLITSM